MASSDRRTDKRKLIDLLLAQRSGMELGPFVTTRRTDGDSWSICVSKIFALTGESVSVPWLIEQCGTGAEIANAGAA